MQSLRFNLVLILNNNLMAYAYKLIAVLLAYSAVCWSEVTLDGSMGSAGTLAGPDFQITENLGHRTEGNLFHSFGSFNLARGESATFSGSSSINNVISRVTGGTPSSIDGALHSSIPNANLYFLNPAGVFFGSNASLDVQGSFHVSTADYLGFKDGTQLSTSSADNGAILSASAPEAFGFLGDNPAVIELSKATLEVPVGNSFSLIAGDILIEGGTLVARAGRIDIASVGSAGEVIRMDNSLQITALNELGRITMNNALVATNGDAGGAIFIRGGELTLDNSVVISETLADNSGKAIDIAVNDNLVLINGGLVQTQTKSAGNAGDLLITARHITVNDDDSKFATGLLSISSSTGNGGDIKIKVESLEVMNSARISTQAFSSGSSGDLSIETERVLLTGKDTVLGSTASTDSSGNAGNLTIHTNALEMRDNAVITVVSNNASLYIEAKDVTLEGDGKNLVTTSISGGSFGVTASESGNTSKASSSNQITLIAENIEIRDGAQISGAKGWDMQIEADNILLDGGVTRSVTGFTSFSNNDAGNISVITANLEVLDGGTISTASVAPGNAGDIHVEADNILLAGQSTTAGITGLHSESLGDQNALVRGGDAGNITVVTSNLEIHDGASISGKSVLAGNSGNINIEAANILLVGQAIEGLDLTGINSESLLGKDAGDISIVADNLEIRNGANIKSNTLEGGKGGDINIEAGRVVLSGVEGFDIIGINSQSLLGKDAGNISIVADNLEIRNGANIKSNTLGGGKGGNINIEAGRVVLSGVESSSDFTRVLSTSSIDLDTDKAGDAGNIRITVDNSLHLDGVIVSLNTNTADGGDIIVSAGQLVQLHDSFIATSVANGKGNGGNIVIGQSPASSNLVRRLRLITLDNSIIFAGAAQGRGGNINISSDFSFGNANSLINASSKTGIDGAININSPESNISGSIAVLPESFLNASEHLSQRCSTRSPSLSSFVIKDRDSIPRGPDDDAVATGFDSEVLQGFSSQQLAVAHADLFHQGVGSINTELDARSGCQ